MNFPSHDTDWATSAKGNSWRRKDGIALIAGKRRDGRYWARRGDDFVSGSFSTLTEAKRAAETGLSSDDESNLDDENWY
jgi:hypothetical protein